MTVDSDISKVINPFNAQQTSYLVILKLLTGDGKSFRLDKDRIVIGSVVSADVRLTGDGVAPIHAVIESAGGIISLYDLASDTGVFVGPQKVVTHPLKPGDEITIGHHKLAFSLEEFKAAGPFASDRIRSLNPEEDFTALLIAEDRPIEEIFDYRPTSRPALEVIMSWHDTVLEVEHFVEEDEITLGGDRKSDFSIPPLLSTDVFILASRTGNGYILKLDPKMRGVIQRQGQLRNITGSEQLQQIQLERSDFAKVIIGDIDFYLSFTTAPPKLKPSRYFERDPLFFKIFATSLILTALVVTALMQLPAPQMIEADQLPERIATLLYQPEKYAYQALPAPSVPPTPANPAQQPPQATEPKREPKPVETVKVEVTPRPEKKPVPEKMDMAKSAEKKNPQRSHSDKASHKKNPHPQNLAKEGEGARAQGKEGTRGTPKAHKDQDHQTAANRPGPNGGTGRGAGDSQVPDEGNVDFLKDTSAKIQDILGNSAAHLGKGGEKLKGFGGFDTQGDNGLALSGNGKGGGGNAATLTGGLSNKGRGGGKIGTGLGATGTGAGIVGGSSRVVIRSGGLEETVVMGSIDSDAIAAAIAAHADEFRLCYEKEINAETPNASGTVIPSFVIGSSGRVTEAGIASSTLDNRNVERCVLNVIKRIQFPLPQGAGVVEVKYPFKFSKPQR